MLQSFALVFCACFATSKNVSGDWNMMVIIIVFQLYRVVFYDGGKCIAKEVCVDDKSILFSFCDDVVNLLIIIIFEKNKIIVSTKYIKIKELKK